MTRKLVLLICITAGSSLGWRLGSPGGLMGSYLAAVAGASAGLYMGRRLQRWMEGED
jgi:outer membrane lipoprotein SlyB